jgi:hypothetical protein
MDDNFYKIKNILISEENINFLQKYVRDNYTLANNEKNIRTTKKKIISIISREFDCYKNEIDDDHFNVTDIISDINEKTINVFELYLIQNFKGKNIYKKNKTSALSDESDMQVSSDSANTNANSNSNASTNSNAEKETNTGHIVNQPESQPNYHTQIQLPISPTFPIYQQSLDHLVIVNTISERQALQAIEKSDHDKIIKRITNPLMIKLYYIMKKSVNPYYYEQNKKSVVVIDKIITKEQLYAKLNNNNNNNNNTVNSENVSIWNMIQKSSEETNIGATIRPDNNILTEPETTSTSATINDDIQINIKKLLEEKQNLLRNTNMNTEENKNRVAEITAELKKIKEKITRDGEKINNTINKCEKKIQNIQSNIENNSLKIKVTLDPDTSDTNIRDIKIPIDQSVIKEKKINKIYLSGYNVNKNKNNVTKYNNIFTIRTDDNTTSITIPPGYYEILMILSYIKNNISCVDFDIDDTKVLTMKNKYGKSFNIIFEEKTILKMLGFNEKDSNKNQKEYQAIRSYQIQTNDNAYFYMKGSSVDKIEMKMNTYVKLNKCIKTSSCGITMTELIINITDINDQHYELTGECNLDFDIHFL